MPLRLEQHRVVDGDRDPARDRAEQVAVVGAVPPPFPAGEPRQRQAHDPEQLTPGVQRQRDHRDEPDVVAGPEAVRAGRRVLLLLQVRHDDDLRSRHGLLAEMALRVVDLLPDGCPRAGRGRPATGVGLYPPDQVVALEEVDEAMVGELRDEHLGDMAEGRAQFQRAAQPLADPLQQPDPVPLRQRARAGGTREDGDAVDRAGRMAQRHRVGADQHAGPVVAGAGEGPLPRPSAQHAPGQPAELVLIAGSEPDAEHGLPGEPARLAAYAQQPGRVRVEIQQVASPVGDDDRHLRLIQQHLRGQERLARDILPRFHTFAP